MDGSGNSGEGCRGWYSPSSPRPGSRIAVTSPKRLDTGGASCPLGLSKGMVVELEQGPDKSEHCHPCRLATALGVGLAQLLEVSAGPEIRKHRPPHRIENDGAVPARLIMVSVEGSGS